MQKSLLRTLCPVEVRACGRVSDAIRCAFISHPALITLLFTTLEELDVDEPPKALFAEGFQQLLSGNRPQRDIRAVFEEAVVHAQRAINGHYDPSRAASDPFFRLNLYELQLAIGYYTRMLGITNAPVKHASFYVHQFYTSDMRTDSLLESITVPFSEIEERPTMSEGALEVIGRLFLLERDIYGSRRFLNRSGQRFLVHAYNLDWVGRNDHTAAVLDHPTVRKYGNFNVEVKNILANRWRLFTVRCREEDHRILSEEINPDADQSSSSSNSGVRTSSAEQGEVGLFVQFPKKETLDVELLGKVEVHYDTPLFQPPPESEIDPWNEFQFELANVLVPARKGLIQKLASLF